MTQIDSENGNTLVLRRRLNAPRGAVWMAWTDPSILKTWFCPAPWSVPEADFNLKPGGRMNTVMAGPNGERMENKGIFLEILPEEKLTFTDAFTEGFIPAENHFMTGFVELSDGPDGTTEFVWGARHPTLTQAQQHLEMGWEQGWNAVTDQLEKAAQNLTAEITE